MSIIRIDSNPQSFNVNTYSLFRFDKLGGCIGYFVATSYWHVVYVPLNLRDNHVNLFKLTSDNHVLIEAIMTLALFTYQARKQNKFTLMFMLSSAWQIL